MTGAPPPPAPDPGADGTAVPSSGLDRLATAPWVQPFGAPGYSPGHGAPGHGTPGHGTPGHGAPGHGAPGHGGEPGWGPAAPTGSPGPGRYGQPEYGQPEYGQPEYGQPEYGQSPYGQPQYGQPPYGQSPYGQPPYGQSPDGQPQYGVPQYGPPGGYGLPPGPRRTSRRTIALIVAGGVLLLVALVALVVAVVDGASRDLRPAPTATGDAAGLGSDPALDRFAADCQDGEMQACDDLFDRSPIDSAYEEYGDTCAGRQPAGTGSYCTEVFTDAE